MFRDWPDFPAVQGLAFGEGGLAQVAGPGVGRVPALPELDRTPDDTANWFWGPGAPRPRALLVLRCVGGRAASSSVGPTSWRQFVTRGFPGTRGTDPFLKADVC